MKTNELPVLNRRKFFQLGALSVTGGWLAPLERPLRAASAEKVKQIHEGMLRQGVAIRPLTAFGLPHCFRITIGLPEENEACIEALKKLY